MPLRRQPTLKTALLIVPAFAVGAAVISALWRSNGRSHEDRVVLAFAVLIVATCARLAAALAIALTVKRFGWATIAWVVFNLLTAGTSFLLVRHPTPTANIVWGVAGLDAFCIVPLAFLLTRDTPWLWLVLQPPCGILWGAITWCIARTCRER